MVSTGGVSTCASAAPRAATAGGPTSLAASSLHALKTLSEGNATSMRSRLAAPPRSRRANSAKVRSATAAARDGWKPRTPQPMAGSASELTPCESAASRMEA